MLDIPKGELDKLVDRVLQKRGWTGTRLVAEMSLPGDHTVSRWRADGKIREEHYEELLRLEKDEAEEPAPNGIPFTVTIPRDSLRFTLDKNGDIIVRGLLVPKKED